MAINYTKIGWDTSKYVNPKNMNQMDDGIKAACDGVDAHDTAIAGKVSKSGDTMTGALTVGDNLSARPPLAINNTNSVGTFTWAAFQNSGATKGFLGIEYGNRVFPIFCESGQSIKEIALKEDTVLKTDISAAKGVCRHYSYGVSDLDISDIQTALVNMMNDRANYPEFATPTSIIITFIKTTTGGSVSCRVACNGMGYFSAIFHSYYFGGDTYLLRYINGSWERFRYSGTSF